MGLQPGVGRDYVGAFCCQDDHESAVYRVDEQSAVWYIWRKEHWQEWSLNLNDGSLNLNDGLSAKLASRALSNPTYRSPFLARLIREDRNRSRITFSIVRFRDGHEVCQVIGSGVKICGNIFVVTTSIDSPSCSHDVWEIAPDHSTASKKFSFDAQCYDLNETMIVMVAIDGSLSLVRIADNHALRVIESEDHPINPYSYSTPLIMTRTHLFSYDWQNDDISFVDLKTLDKLYTLTVEEPEDPIDERDNVHPGHDYRPTDDGTMLFKQMDGRSILIDPKRNAPWMLRPPDTSRARTSGKDGVYVLARDYSLQEDGNRTLASGETVVLWQEIPSEPDAWLACGGIELWE
ncbi:hypothetical protein HK104_008784 [Borealophlyctis nickersoniae]|nr:hypothetical protein HK104_008784 [Borealophlyctis nickersoniae]